MKTEHATLVPAPSPARRLTMGRRAGGVLAVRSWRRAVGGALLLAVTSGWLAPPVLAQDTFQLVSAQVVTSTDRPATLRVAASGPIAFHVLTPEEGGQPTDGAAVTVRLYGVKPGQLATLDGLQPFAVAVTGAGTDSLMTVGAAAVAPDAKVRVRAGQRSHELEFVVTGA